MRTVLLFFALFSFSFANAQPGISWGLSVGSYWYACINFCEDVPTAAVTDDYGNVYITGAYSGIIDMDPSAANTYLLQPASQGLNYYVASYTADGSFRWARNCQASFLSSGKTIAYDNAGFIYTGGFFSDSAAFDQNNIIPPLNWPNGSSRSFICKYDTAGNVIWVKHFEGQSIQPAHVAVNSKKELFVYGDFLGTIDFDPSVNVSTLTAIGNNDHFFAKYDSSGSFVWVKHAGVLSDRFCVDSADNIYMCGNFDVATDFDFGPGVTLLTPITPYDVFIAKYDSTLQLTWVKSIENLCPQNGGSSIYMFEFRIDHQSNIVLTGYCDSAAVIDFDPSAAQSSSGSGTIYLAKYDTYGNYLWHNRLTSKNTWPSALAIDSGNCISVAGQFERTVDFDPSPAVYQLTADSIGPALVSGDEYLAKYDPGGNLLYAKTIHTPAPYASDFTALHYDGFNNLYLLGYLTDSANFAIDGSQYMVSAGLNTQIDIHVIKYNDSCIHILPAPLIVNNNLTVCAGDNLEILLPQSYTNYHFYADSNLTLLLYTGNVLNLQALQSDTSFYITQFNDCTESSAAYLIVNVIPISAAISGPDTICSGQAAMLIASGGITYLWNTGQTSDTIFVTPLLTSIYSVTVTNAVGCTYATQMQVVVQVCNGTEDRELGGVRVFPNPVKDDLYINSDFNGGVSLHIYTPQGTLIFSDTFNGNKHYNIGHLAKGIYFVKLTYMGQSLLSKILKD